jgi:uncharacterized protein YndB with AHSA1/START domain
VPSFTTRLTIDRAPQQVFAVLDDLDAARRWMPAIRRILVLTPGEPMGVGFKWRETRRLFGIFRMSLVLTIMEHERPTTWALEFNDGKLRARATFHLKPSGRGTQATFTEDIEDLQGRPERAQTMLRRMEKQDGDLLERLKAYVESTTEPPAHRPATAAPRKTAAKKPPKSSSASKPVRKTKR